MGPFTFNGVRSLIGLRSAASLYLALFQKGKGKATEKPSRGAREGTDRRGIAACRLLLFAASSLQQIGIQYTTAGKAGFITAFYIVIVPVLGIFLHKKISGKVWGAVAIALAGLYFLCITEKFAVGKGDILIFLCALVFSIHILVIDYFSPKVDGVKMSCIQFFVCGIVSLPPMFFTETPKIGAIVGRGGRRSYMQAFCPAAWLSHFADHWPEECEPGGRFINLKPGVLLFRASRMDGAGRKLSMRESVGCVLMFGAIILGSQPAG